MKKIRIIVFFLCGLWPTIARAGYLRMMMDDANEGGSILGNIFLFIALYLIGFVCLFFGFLVKFLKHSSTPNYFKTCFRITTDEVEGVTGTAFILSIICTTVFIVVYAIVLTITGMEMTIGGFITVVAIGFTCSIVVASSISLISIKADKYFQNTPNAASHNDEEQRPPPIIETEVKKDSSSESSSYTKNSERKTFKWKSNYTVLGILILSVAAFIFFVIFGPRQAEKPKTQEAPPVMTEAEINGFKIIVSSTEIEIMAESTCSKLTESKDYMTGKTVKTCYKYGWKKWVNNKYLITAGKLKSKIKKDSDVAVPATQILVYPDNTKRLIFNGCRPHACPDAEAFFLLDTTNKNMDIIWNVEGKTKYIGPNAELLKQNNIYAYLSEYK